MSEWVDEVAPAAGAPVRGGRDMGNSRGSRGSITEDVVVGSMVARPAAGAGSVDEDFTVGPRGGRALSDGARKMLANIDKHDSVHDESPPAATGAAVAVSPDLPVVTPAGAAPVAAAVAPPPAPDPAAEHIEARTKLEEHNRKLVAELAAARARPARGEPTARDKALDEAEKGYLGDSVGSVRRLIATALGIEDPASKDVDKELTYLYHDLTKRELGVALDPAVQNDRENDRTRRMLERDRRERTAPVSAPDETAARTAQDAAQATAIAGMLPGLKHAEKYPLLTAHSEALHSAKPEVLIWEVIKHEIAAGVIRPDANGKYPDDATLIDHASKTIETRYQALRDRFAPAAATSTATPTQPTVTTDAKADPAPGVRTITNASASVAPATLPAAKPEPTTAPMKFKNDKERIRYLANKHFPDAR